MPAQLVLPVGWAKEHLPTIADMKSLRKWKVILMTGHSQVFMRHHARGERTKVSHAATVSVQTKKYLCALS